MACHLEMTVMTSCATCNSFSPGGMYTYVVSHVVRPHGYNVARVVHSKAVCLRSD